jgi:hypothetical protein
MVAKQTVQHGNSTIGRQQHHGLQLRSWEMAKANWRITYLQEHSVLPTA